MSQEATMSGTTRNETRHTLPSARPVRPSSSRKTHGRSRSGRERGAVLLAAIVVVTIVAAFIGSFVVVTSNGQRDQTLQEQKLRAFYAAEAGLTAALAEINTGLDPGGDGLGTVGGSLGSETFQATATPNATGYDVASTGVARGARRTIQQVVELGPGPFSGAFLSVDAMTLSGVTIDSYDSTQGTYGSQVVGFDPNIGREYARKSGDVGGFGSISIFGSTGILGDVRPGPGASVSYGSGSWYVSGDEVPFADPSDLPSISYDPPALEPVEVDLKGNQTATYTEGTYRFSEVELSGQSVLTFAGDVTVYLDEELEIEGGATLAIAPGAKVTILQGGGSVSISGNGIVNQTQDSLSLAWRSASTESFTMSGTASFHGTIYAPDAPVTITGVVEGYGSVVGATLNAGGATVWHYDEALRTVQPLDTPPEYTSILWRAP